MKSLTNHKSKQAGMISPILMVFGVVILIIIVVLVSSGALKFQGSISKGNPQSTLKQSNTVSKETSTPKNKTYTNTAYDIILGYPENWSIKENPGEGVIVAFGSPKESVNDKFVDNVNLTITDVSSKPDMTLGQLTDLWLKQTGSTPSFEMLSKEAVNIGAETANQLVFSYKNEGMEIKGMVTIVLKNNKAYIITYSAETGSYSKFLEVASDIASSLKIN